MMHQHAIGPLGLWNFEQWQQTAPFDSLLCLIGQPCAGVNLT
jgi:hypothetical protein